MGAFKNRDIDEQNALREAARFRGGQFTDSFEGTFSVIYSEALELLINRQRKYGPENIRQQGIYGVITRIADDKLARVKQSLNGTLKNGKVELDPIKTKGGTGEGDDSFEDALLDIANYALIALALHRGVWGKPLIEDMEDDFDAFIKEWSEDDDFDLPDILNNIGDL